ncbi:MAG TPA: alpha/beta fold hydrolase [Caldilineaceae bacterium]|nr:alpha/beta fold hydrolase [Caldilineaceae bacterium]
MTNHTAQVDGFPKIGAPALRALNSAGYHSLEELAKVREADLAKLHGMGPKALGILRDALAAKGLAFAGEQVSNQGAYAEVNGIRLYYAYYGKPASQEVPLVILHGGLSRIEMMHELIEALESERTIIGVDLQAHGRTADIDRPIRYPSCADDIGGLIQHLGLEQVDLLGYSFGGGVALRTAIQYPELVRKLVLISTPTRQSGWLPDVLEGMSGISSAIAESMRNTPMYEHYVDVAPRPEDFPQLLDKMGDLMRQENDSTADIAGLSMPVMLVYGDADSIAPSHAAEFFGLLGGGQRDAGWDGSGMTKHRLVILPGTTHYNVHESPLAPLVVKPFLAEG